MTRIALALAVAGLIAAAVPSPGLYLAIGCGMAAIGVGWLTWRQRALAGGARLGAAAAMTLGGAALAMGVLRVAIALAAIAHVEKLLT
nr:hypothetical protein [Kofleriaceae bacterium]